MVFGCLSTAQAQLHVVNGETVKVTSADDLVLLDNLANNGSIERITLSGTSAQTVTGTGTINHLKLSKTALVNTATISSGIQSVTGTLDLTAGTLAVGGTTSPYAAGFLTLKSTSTGTAQVMSHTITGTVTGNVVVERFIAANGRNNRWRMLGFPYSAALPLSSLGGFARDFSSTTPSMMHFNESADNGASGTGGARNAGYVSFTSSSESIPLGKGIMAWLYGNAGGTAANGTMTGDLTISSFGPLNESGTAVSLPLSFNAGQTVADNRGWNLMSNPYASAIDWSSNAITKTRIDAAVYRYDPQNIRWTTHTGTSGTNGADKIIESGGAFFVKANDASPVLSIGQDAKVSGGSSFTHFERAPNLRSERVRSPIRLAGVRMAVTGQGNPAPDEVYIDLSRDDATAGFDSRYDAESRGRSGGAGIRIMGRDDMGYAMQFDAPIKESGVEKRYYPLKVTSPAKGATTLELWTEGAWNPLNSVSLIDRREGRTVLLKGGRITYPFTMDELQSGDRFQLAINHVKVDKDGLSPAFDVRVLGNPIASDRLDLLVAHPTAKADKWSVLTATGQQAGMGSFSRDVETVQHRITVPGMRQPGTYLLRVLMDNGDEKVVKVVRH